MTALKSIDSRIVKWQMRESFLTDHEHIGHSNRFASAFKVQQTIYDKSLRFGHVLNDIKRQWGMREHRTKTGQTQTDAGQKVVRQ